MSHGCFFKKKKKTLSFSNKILSISDKRIILSLQKSASNLVADMASVLLSARVVAHGGTCCSSSQDICFRQRHCRLVVICSSPSLSSPSTRPRSPPIGRRSASLAVVLLHCLSYSPKRTLSSPVLFEFKLSEADEMESQQFMSCYENPPVD